MAIITHAPLCLPSVVLFVFGATVGTIVLAGGISVGNVGKMVTNGRVLDSYGSSVVRGSVGGIVSLIVGASVEEGIMGVAVDVVVIAVEIWRSP